MLKAPVVITSDSEIMSGEDYEYLRIIDSIKLTKQSVHRPMMYSDIARKMIAIQPMPEPSGIIYYLDNINKENK